MKNRGVLLAEYINSLCDMRQGPEEAVCVFVACDWVDLYKGVDPAEPWRGRWRTRRGAARVLRRGGFDVLQDAVDTAAGLTRLSSPTEALRGDLATVGEGAEQWLGIVDQGTVVGVGGTGIVRVPLSSATAAWRV